MSSSVIHCTSCDAVIKDPSKRKSSQKTGGEVFLTGRVELNTFRRYLLNNVDRSEVNALLELFDKQLPLCSLCMEMVNRIYDFENEIDRIKCLIDSMVTLLKNKVLATFDPGSSARGSKEEKILKIRTMITGKLDDLPLTDQVVIPSINDEDVNSLMTEVRSSYHKFQDTNPVIKVEPELPSSSKRPIKKPKDLDSIWDDGRGINVGEDDDDDTAVKDEGDDWDLTAEVGSDHWDDSDLDEDDESEDDGETSRDGSVGKKTGAKRRKTEPGEIPKYKQRKTDRRPRKSIKLGNNCYEFQGNKFSKEEDGTWKCLTCSNVLKTRSTVLEHIKLIHLGEGVGNWLCATCGKNFTNRTCYRSHLSVHTDIKGHQCDICGHAFRLLGNLIQHKKIHEGESEMHFKCDYEGCDRKFLRKKQLTRHIMTHTGDRPHICERCGKSFLSQGDLNGHMKIHMGPEARKFICDLCGKAFLTNSHLKRHKRNLHKVDPDEGINSRLDMERKVPGEVRIKPDVGSVTHQPSDIGHFLSTELFSDF